VRNAGLNQLYLSAYHLAPDLIPHYVQALRDYSPTFLLTYPSAVAAIANAILHQGLPKVPLKVVVTNAEPLYAWQREAIEAAFQCPVRETYGMAELVTFASECDAGRLHLSPELGVLEVMDGERQVPCGISGDLVGTGLLNGDMPLIRYRIGDRGAFPVVQAACPCGCSLPQLAYVEGRKDDVLYTRDGRAVGRLDPVFKSSLSIREAQIVQESLDRVRVRYVPTAAFTTSDGDAIRQRLQDRLGAIEIVLEPCETIAREMNGKFRAVICTLSEEERQSLQSRRSEPLVD
jgi:phenylacetate-CoA ligase